MEGDSGYAGTGRTIRSRVEARDAGERIDRYLARLVPGSSRSHLARLFSEGRVTLDGRPCRKNHRLRTGETVEMVFLPPESPEVGPEAIPLSVLYEDRDIVVVDKPRGMVVHPAPGSPGQTLVNALLAHCGDLSGINGVLRPGIVHRIDKDTTGIIVAAKHDAAHRGLARQFHDHTITRRYTALVHGTIGGSAGRIEAPIGRDPRDRKRMAVTPGAGREACTHYRVLRRYPGFTLVELTLETGRTHQIRVHMEYIGHPVAGDPRYGPRRAAPGGVRGQLLHAGHLGFSHPVTGEPMEFQTPPPADFQSVLSGWESQGSEGPR